MAKKNRSRVEIDNETKPLTDSPFGALAELQKKDLPQAKIKTVTKAVEKEQLPYTIERTRKGGLDLRVERRPGGKVVTVLRRVSGDIEGLVKILKKKCGAGGVARDDSIEIQGDHMELIEAFLG